MNSVQSKLKLLFFFNLLFIFIFCYVEFSTTFKMFIKEYKSNTCNNVIIKECKSYTCNNEKSSSLEDVYNLKKKIFFLETSNRLNLTLRQACSIESAALSNPLSSVIVFMNTTDKNINLHTKLRENYANIHFFELNIEEIFKHSPVEGFHQRQELLESPHRVSHTSDVLRYTIVWKFGGAYFDLDEIIMKEIDILKNCMAYESTGMVGSSILIFDQYQQYLLECLKEVNATYNGKEWAANGPFLVTRVFGKYCKKQSNACDVTVHDNKTFFPIFHGEYYIMFQKDKTDNVMKRVNGSYGIHFWNKLSENDKVNVGSDVAYERLAKMYCPLTFKFAEIRGYL